MRAARAVARAAARAVAARLARSVARSPRSRPRSNCFGSVSQVFLIRRHAPCFPICRTPFPPYVRNQFSFFVFLASAETPGSLDGVDAVLGAPLLLFDASTLVGWEHLPRDSRETACLALFYAVDWLRELLNAFCGQSDPEMRGKASVRLRQLVMLERQLDRCLARTDAFRLPGLAVSSADEAAERRARARQVERVEPAPPVAHVAQRLTTPTSLTSLTSLTHNHPIPLFTAHMSRLPFVTPHSPPMLHTARFSATSRELERRAKDERKAAEDLEKKLEKAQQARSKKKAKRGAGSDVESSDGEGFGGGASSGAPTSSRGRPKPPTPFLRLAHLRRVEPALRGVSIETAVMLTYGDVVRTEVDTAGETAAMETMGELDPG